MKKVLIGTGHFLEYRVYALIGTWLTDFRFYLNFYPRLSTVDRIINEKCLRFASVGLRFSSKLTEETTYKYKSLISHSTEKNSFITGNCFEQSLRGNCSRTTIEQLLCPQLNRSRPGRLRPEEQFALDTSRECTLPTQETIQIPLPFNRTITIIHLRN